MEHQLSFADAGYRDAEKRDELKDRAVDWRIAERPEKVMARKKHPGIRCSQCVG